MSEKTDSLADRLIETWAQQGRDGFLLTDPDHAGLETKEATDPASGVTFRFRWLPHREIRGDVGELERRGILNADRDEDKLFRDPRDPKKRHCFLCRANIAECHPMERLVPMTLDGREYYAGANFAWIEPDHFTVMTAEHTDQVYSRHAVDAMLDLYRQTDGRFRVIFNGPGAGASIPWHLHYQITSESLPIEALSEQRETEYPTAVRKFPLSDVEAASKAHAFAEDWVSADRENHTVNLMAAGQGDAASLYVFPRDQRRATAEEKGLVGGFEVAGDFVLSSPAERGSFEQADPAVARSILSQVRPPQFEG